MRAQWRSGCSQGQGAQARPSSGTRQVRRSRSRLPSRARTRTGAASPCSRTGAHSMVTGDLWNEKVKPGVLLGFCIKKGTQTELRVKIYTSELIGVFQEIHYISSL